jgi:hypothetical protein
VVDVDQLAGAAAIGVLDHRSVAFIGNTDRWSAGAGEHNKQNCQPVGDAPGPCSRL